MMTSCEQSILGALAYADLFDVPLTQEEIWRNLFFPIQKNITFFDVIDAVEHSNILSHFIESHGGFYFLKGRKDIVATRLERYDIAKRKYDSARKVIRMLARIPFMRFIGICNTLGWSNAKDESDIDLFIIVEHQHLWLTRSLCASLMQMYGLRPTKQKMKDAICLSFFISDTALDVSPLFLQESHGMSDIYFLYWLLYCVPIYDSGDMYEKFWKANEVRIYSVLPYATPYNTNEYRRVGIGRVYRTVKYMCEQWIRLFGNISERVARWIQIRVLPQELRNVLNKDTRVVMNDSVMKFHPNDRREEIRERFWKKLQELGMGK